jgi:hypothetical protein
MTMYGYRGPWERVLGLVVEAYVDVVALGHKSGAIVAGDLRNGPAKCGGGRHPSVQAQMAASVRLPPSWASPTVAPCGVGTTSTHPPSRHAYLPVSDVAAIDTLLHPSMDACWCTPPTIAGESDNGSMLCAGDRHPLSSRSRRLPVCASHHRRQVSNGSVRRGGD